MGMPSDFGNMGVGGYVGLMILVEKLIKAG